MSKALDYIVTIQHPDGPEITTDKMSSTDAHELFAWLTSYITGARITLEQVVEERRRLWKKYARGGPTVCCSVPAYSRRDPQKRDNTMSTVRKDVSVSVTVIFRGEAV